MLAPFSAPHGAPHSHTRQLRNRTGYIDVLPNSLTMTSLVRFIVTEWLLEQELDSTYFLDEVMNHFIGHLSFPSPSQPGPYLPNPFTAKQARQCLSLGPLPLFHPRRLLPAAN